MDYTSIHIYAHLLSDDILKSVEHDSNFIGNRQVDFGLDVPVERTIDYAWSAFRNDWNFYKERMLVNDTYGTRRSRDLIERLLQNLGYNLTRQNTFVEANGASYEINYLCEHLQRLPVCIIGDRIIDECGVETLDRCSLDYRAKGSRKKRSVHATMLEYLNATENIYGIISNGRVLRLIRNSGQLVKLTYIEFDLQKMLEEDKYTEFCLLFRLLHASRFKAVDDESCVMERWFNKSIESGNRIRAGLSNAVQYAMETLGKAVLRTEGKGNQSLREALSDHPDNVEYFNRELILFIYRLLFLFIIEDRKLVYQIPEDTNHPEYKQLCAWQEIYYQYYAASRLRKLSELSYLKQNVYNDIWKGLMETFSLFEEGEFGEKLGIKPLGGNLFAKNALYWLSRCVVSNRDLLTALAALNEFTDERQQRVKINYSSLDVEEFGSVYEGILEKKPLVQPGTTLSDWSFSYVEGLNRKSTSSYYTRPDLVQHLISSALEPVIREKIAKHKTVDEQIKALLNMKVCDAASGSGHIVLAMARTIAWYVCVLRTGEDNPASRDYREALREVISHCIYAVDYNPDAVELCKVVLWIEGYCAGKPLSFLDHHIRCGNSVVGVSDLDVLLDGVPNDAFSSEDKAIKKKILDLNKAALKEVKALKDKESKQNMANMFDENFTIQRIGSEQINLAKEVRIINALPENTLLEQLTKQSKWEDLMRSPRVECLRKACDIYTYAFFKDYKDDELVSEVNEDNKFSTVEVPYTRTVYKALEEIKYLEEPGNVLSEHCLSEKFCKEIEQAAYDYRFFHWAIEFPEVFAYDGGFDVMCGNPPWDKLQMEEDKWFSGKDDKIANADNQNKRKQLIDGLQTSNPDLYALFIKSKKLIADQSRFVRNSYRFPLTAVGKLELSSLFAELCLNFSKEAWGLVLPTGIAVNDSNKAFLSKLIDENRLISLYDFENSEKLFDIHRMFKFCLLTAGKDQKESRTVSGGFYLTRLDHLLDPRRVYTLQTEDFARFNPNTKLCPTFRASMDAQLTAKIYRKAPILYNEVTGYNPWSIKFKMLFNMASASKSFSTRKQLDEAGGIQIGDSYFVGDIEYVPLYEGKMIWFYNHHYGSFPSEYTVSKRPDSIESTVLSDLQDFLLPSRPWYWVRKTDVENRLVETDRNGNIRWQWRHSYYIAFRDVTNATNERTCVATIIPSGKAAGNNTPLVFTSRSIIPSASFAALISSLLFDFVARQKVGGSHMNLFIMKQMPVLTPDQIPIGMQWQIVKRVAELSYFNHDLDGWAEELWAEMNDEQRAELPQLGDKQPWIFNPDRRAVLQAELDAIFAHLYGLNTEDLRYILDPEDICGAGCINETFRVLKDNEIRQFGEYRTKRLVLDAWKRLNYDIS